MDIRKLRYFITVAEELHFHRAAEKLNMTQPPLSQQIQNLEEELGVKLLERTKKMVRLTAAGAVFLEQARLIMAQLERSIQLTQKADQGIIGHLTVAFVDSASGSIMVDVLRKFRAAYPQIELTLREMTSSEQLQALADGQIHIGFLRYQDHTGHLSFRVCQTETLIAVLPDHHPLASQTQVSITELADEDFILFPRHLGSPFHRLVLDYCREHGVDPRITQEAIQMYTIVNLVAAGMGISIVPSSVDVFERRGVVFLPLIESPPSVPLYTAWRTDMNQEVISRFMNIVDEIVEGEYKLN